MGELVIGVVGLGLVAVVLASFWRGVNSNARQIRAALDWRPFVFNTMTNTNRPHTCGAMLRESWAPESPSSLCRILEWCPNCEGSTRVIVSDCPGNDLIEYYAPTGTYVAERRYDYTL